ncbi:His-Xaa-Ser system radical SAM maturase HxsC [Salinisphaera hydrothermalis]|uniref:His-Xaa-Ser system radical SAM maturase HxsC n=1 Tax=Salinisphaera hydrothermalis TaxID=563188 RepID=UPI0033404CB9
MMALYSKASRFIGWPEGIEPFVAKVVTSPGLPGPIAKDAVLLVDRPADVDADTASKFRGIVTKTSGQAGDCRCVVELEPDLGHVSAGDVMRLDPARSRIRVLFQRRATHNSLLVTERCNSFCLMCSQPPRAVDDSHLIEEIKRTIELIPRETPRLGLSGGEPTLCGDGFFEIVRHARNYLPDTELHILTNGRSFQSLEQARRLADVGHPNLKLGIPLYSEQPDRHDFVVQAKGAFDETVKGLLNLSVAGIRVELRVVLHQHTYARLPELARFIGRNLPFVEYVALMGLELTGFAKVNLGNLWIDPYDYQDELAAAVRVLDRSGVPVLIFNHQLCVVPESVRDRCVQSISDWKNDYLDCCDGCEAKSQCGGFFSSGLGLAKHSDHIAPIEAVTG